MLNLGSQSGLEALIMGKIVGPTGKLFIFESYSFSNKLVTKNIELNNLQSITTIYKYGVSDTKTKAIIQVACYNTGGPKSWQPDLLRQLTEEEASSTNNNKYSWIGSMPYCPQTLHWGQEIIQATWFLDTINKIYYLEENINIQK